MDTLLKFNEQKICRLILEYMFDPRHFPSEGKRRDDDMRIGRMENQIIHDNAVSSFMGEKFLDIGSKIRKVYPEYFSYDSARQQLRLD